MEGRYAQMTMYLRSFGAFGDARTRLDQLATNFEIVAVCPVALERELVYSLVVWFDITTQSRYLWWRSC